MSITNSGIVLFVPYTKHPQHLGPNGKVRKMLLPHIYNLSNDMNYRETKFLLIIFGERQLYFLPNSCPKGAPAYIGLAAQSSAQLEGSADPNKIRRILHYY